MPKDRRVNSSSFDRATVSPYSCSSKISDRKNCDSSSPQVGDEREWEEARCPICMEHPHNAVLLLCSSREKGCRPFICDTSYRHSNCLDQYRKSAAASSLPGEQQSELVCPLCRGVITGWDVVQPARTFMNSKMRSCSLETCGFTGNYAELRKHARLEHPTNDHRRPAPPGNQIGQCWSNKGKLRMHLHTSQILSMTGMVGPAGMNGVKMICGVMEAFLTSQVECPILRTN
ncbi:UNVERIFIED_CONTAM: hypothetical protein Sradi_1043400 [Sesamum radiatum]|uniref:Uncharacterized protein n=1 Tax=Sesamum radiatum TaxID=300843 RepID=A0AAW2VA19_SESRA